MKEGSRCSFLPLKAARSSRTIFASSLAPAISHWNAGSVTTAAGDSENDLELLGAAGIGVTVGNAGDKVKAVAGYVSEKGDGDGFVEAVMRYRPYFLER